MWKKSKEPDDSFDQLKQCLRPFEDKVFNEIRKLSDRLSQELADIKEKLDERQPDDVLPEPPVNSFQRKLFATAKQRSLELEDADDIFATASMPASPVYPQKQWEETEVLPLTPRETSPRDLLSVSSTMLVKAPSAILGKDGYTQLSGTDDFEEPFHPVQSPVPEKMKRRPLTVMFGTKSMGLDCFATAIIILNVFFIGLEVEVELEYHFKMPPAIRGAFDIGDLIFFFLFASELVFRVSAYGWSFFSVKESGWYWNWMDTGLVAVQAFDEIIKYATKGLPYRHDLVSIVRALRILRILRVFRLLNITDRLGMLVYAIMVSIRTVIWALFIMIIFVFVFSVGFAERIWRIREGRVHGRLEYFFGSVPRIMLTLTESILGGLSWDEVASPLFNEVGAGTGLAFLCFVFIGLFILVNVVTGVFIDGVSKSSIAEEQKEARNHLRAALDITDATQRQISKEDFGRRVKYDPGMQDYFKTNNIEPSKAAALFSFLDRDENGYLSLKEVYEGCLRLREPARFFDISLLMQDIDRLRKGLKHVIKSTNYIHTQIHKMSASSTARSREIDADATRPPQAQSR